ncbi:MAG: FtsX-like permease family protein [Acidobacteriota bacterium]
MRQSPGGDRGRGVHWQMALPLPLTLATRYLKSTRRDAHVSFLSKLAAGGIALGVAALVLVLAGLSGLQGFLRDDVLARTPHLEIELPADGADVDGVVESVAAVPGVEGVREILRGRGWLLIQGDPINVQVVGFDGELPAFFPRSAEEAEAALAQGVFVGRGVALRWGLEVGSGVDLVSPRPSLTPFGPQPRIQRLRMAGTFETGRTEEQDPRVAVPLDTARRLFGGGGRRLEVRATDLETALAVAPRIEGTLPAAAELRTWRDLNRGLFFALELEKTLMFLSVFLIVPVAAMALVTVLALLISSKRSEIGMLHAMGTTPRDVERAFLGLGAMLASIGLVGGAVLGVGGAFLLDRFRLIRPPGDAYFIDHVPFRVEPGDLGMVMAATVAFTFLSTWYAARKAGSLEPTEVLGAP